VIVGTVMITAVYYQIFMPFIYMPLGYYNACVKRIKAKRALVQKEAKSHLLKPEFNINTKQANALQVVFISVVLSSGMPILLLCSSGVFFVAYFREKWNLLRKSSFKIKIDSRINTWCISSMRTIILMHFVLAIVMFTVTDIFDQQDLTGATAYDRNDSSKDILQELKGRVMSIDINSK